MEEFKAEGLTEEELFAFWEWDNRSRQPHKIAQPFYLTPDILQQWWSLKDVHEFCLKHCAIYATVDCAFPRELADYLWAKWFRKDTPCRFGNSFAKFVAAYKPESPKTVPELLEAHRRICAQVLLRQVTLDAHDIRPYRPMSVDERAYDVYEDHENYKLEATFHAVFIVMDTLLPLPFSPAGSRDDRDFVAAIPVLLVRTGEHHDLRTGPVDFASIEASSEEVDGNTDVRRIPLGHAVDFILDLHRRNSEID
ncbi:MAG: hypothetical protein L6R39_002775 [Caloplaca ligustica]|nr:MAG: hypothetical protein L6R39_002775 [Caloplaca ligustica]